MIRSKKYAVFSREMPPELIDFISKDGHIIHNKDGVRTSSTGHKCPRLSLIVQPTGNTDKDKSRVTKLEHLLKSLEKLHKIVSFSK